MLFPARIQSKTTERALRVLLVEGSPRWEGCQCHSTGLSEIMHHMYHLATKPTEARALGPAAKQVHACNVSLLSLEQRKTVSKGSFVKIDQQIR